MRNGVHGYFPLFPIFLNLVYQLSSNRGLLVLMNPEKEQQLTALTKTGDEAAFRELVEAYHHLLFKTLITKVGDEELARDLTQDAFVKIWIKRRILRPEQSFFAILVKIAVNLMQDEFRRTRVREKYRAHVSDLWRKADDNPEHSIALRQLQDKVAQIIAVDLPERCRQVFVLSRVEGLPNDQVAQLLNISKKTVENQLNHAMKILRKKCGRDIFMGAKPAWFG